MGKCTLFLVQIGHLLRDILHLAVNLLELKIPLTNNIALTYHIFNISILNRDILNLNNQMISQLIVL